MRAVALLTLVAAATASFPPLYINKAMRTDELLETQGLLQVSDQAAGDGAQKTTGKIPSSPAKAPSGQVGAKPNPISATVTERVVGKTGASGDPAEPESDDAAGSKESSAEAKRNTADQATSDKVADNRQKGSDGQAAPLAGQQTASPAEKPASAQPAEKPASTQPAEKPASTQPVVEKPASTQPAAGTPADAQPVVEKPGSKQPAEKPVAGNEAVAGKSIDADVAADKADAKAGSGSAAVEGVEPTPAKSAAKATPTTSTGTATEKVVDDKPAVGQPPTGPAPQAPTTAKTESRTNAEEAMAEAAAEKAELKAADAQKREETSEASQGAPESTTTETPKENTKKTDGPVPKSRVPLDKATPLVQKSAPVEAAKPHGDANPYWSDKAVAADEAADAATPAAVAERDVKAEEQARRITLADQAAREDKAKSVLAVAEQKVKALAQAKQSAKMAAKTASKQSANTAAASTATAKVSTAQLQGVEGGKPAGVAKAADEQAQSAQARAPAAVSEDLKVPIVCVTAALEPVCHERKGCQWKGDRCESTVVDVPAPVAGQTKPDHHQVQRVELSAAPHVAPAPAQHAADKLQGKGNAVGAAPASHTVEALMGKANPAAESAQKSEQKQPAESEAPTADPTAADPTATDPTGQQHEADAAPKSEGQKGMGYQPVPAKVTDPMREATRMEKNAFLEEARRDREEAQVTAAASAEKAPVEQTPTVQPEVATGEDAASPAAPAADPEAAASAPPAAATDDAMADNLKSTREEAVPSAKRSAAHAAAPASPAEGEDVPMGMGIMKEAGDQKQTPVLHVGKPAETRPAQGQAEVQPQDETEAPAATNVAQTPQHDPIAPTQKSEGESPAQGSDGQPSPDAVNDAKPDIVALAATSASATEEAVQGADPAATAAGAGPQGKPLELPSATLWAMSPEQLRDAVRGAAGAGVFQSSQLDQLNNPTQLLQYCCPNCHSACPSYPGGPPLGLPVHKDSLMPQAEAEQARSGEAALTPVLVQAEAGGGQAADGARPATRVAVFNDAAACSATGPPDADFELDASPKCRSFLPTGNGSEALPSIKSYRLSCANGTAQGSFYSQPCAGNSAKTQLASFTLEQGPGAASCVTVDGKAVLIQCAGAPEPSAASGYEPLPVALAAALAVVSAWLA